ncbi:MAG: periplasmic heavy metal sensor [bacterium]
MTDPIATPTVPPQPIATPPSARGLKIALAVSVALNLAVAGVVGGIVLHGGPGGHDMMVRDLGFGPYDAALLPQDRDTLRKAIQGRLGDLRSARQQLQTDGAAILAALRATPFDAGKLSEALNGQSQHLNDRMNLGSGMIRDFLIGLPQDARLAFADRLEAKMRHGRGPDAGPGDGKGDADK